MKKIILASACALAACECEAPHEEVRTTCQPTNRSIVTCKQYVVQSCSEGDHE